MDRTLKKYINDLTLTILLVFCPDKQDTFIDFKKVRLRMLSAIKNYVNFRLKLLRNPEIIKVEHKLIRKAFSTAVESGCNKYNINIPNEVKDKIIDDYFEQLLQMIHEHRVNIFMDMLAYCEANLRLN